MIEQAQQRGAACLGDPQQSSRRKLKIQVGPQEELSWRVNQRGRFINGGAGERKGRYRPGRLGQIDRLEDDVRRWIAARFVFP